jgi:hypothetical protein
MNAITKLAAAALGALSIAGGVAVAQDASSKDPYAHPDTANYGTPPGAPLKRDGSLLADPTPVAPATNAMTDSSGTTTTTATSTTPPAAPVAADTSTTRMPAADTSAPVADASLQPRADRN